MQKLWMFLERNKKPTAMTVDVPKTATLSQFHSIICEALEAGTSGGVQVQLVQDNELQGSFGSSTFPESEAGNLPSEGNEPITGYGLVGGVSVKVIGDFA